MSAPSSPAPSPARPAEPRLVPVGPARLDEALGILRHLRPALGRETLAEALRPGGPAHRLGYRLLGIEIGGRLVALAGARPLITLARGRHLHVDDVVVDPAWRGRGIGRLLLEGLEARARREDLGALHLDSLLEARAFYEALGFTAMGCLPMVKRLAPRAEGGGGGGPGD